MGTRCANHVTPLYPQKLALNSPTGGGRSVGMVRSQTKATEFSFFLVFYVTMHRDTLWKCMEEFKMPKKLINMCKTCVQKQELLLE